VLSGDDPRALLREAQHFERAGRLAEAQAAYQRLLSRHPDLPDSWYNLALLQRRAGQFDAALASYQQALDRGIARPEEVHLNRGVIYADCLRQDAAAEQELQAALVLNPRYIPAWLNLANLHEDLGRRDQALATYEKLLALDPQQSEALARYASLKGASGPEDALIARLRRALARPGIGAAEKASLGFALGKLLDGCGAYDAAFEAYAAANRDSRRSAGTGTVLYDRRRHEQLIDAIIAAFRERSPASTAAVTAPVRPIFICGMFRSGSTLFERILARHPHVAAGGEIDFFPRLAQAAPFPAGLAQLSAAQRQQLAARYLALLQRLHPGAPYVTDKRPDNFLYIGLIKTLFPDAPIIHTRRNALDNCLSIYFLHLGHQMGYALDLEDIAHYYRQCRRLMSHWTSVYGADILDVDYDALVHEPRPVVERALGFCGLDWDERCLDFGRADGTVKTASVWQVREPLYRHASGRWRHYERHLGGLRRALGELAAEG
jgi:tetratricopeptide (TPR) repeat protein